MFPPERIVCLTEETVETLYLLRGDKASRRFPRSGRRFVPGETWRQHTPPRARLGQQFRAASCRYVPGFQPHHVAGDPLHFGRVMADIDHGHNAVVAQALEVREDLAFARGIE